MFEFVWYFRYNITDVYNRLYYILYISTDVALQSWHILALGTQPHFCRMPRTDRRHAIFGAMERDARPWSCSQPGTRCDDVRCITNGVKHGQSTVPSGELTFCFGKSPFLMGKSTISMAIFHCYVSSPEGRIQVETKQKPSDKSRNHADGHQKRSSIGARKMRTASGGSSKGGPTPVRVKHWRCNDNLLYKLMGKFMKSRVYLSIHLHLYIYTCVCMYT